ncbi:MAG TPA: hypothetical protein VF527_08400 [Pyrinomonadaceae bacterium]|jgi:hypothetical protein
MSLLIAPLSELEDDGLAVSEHELEGLLSNAPDEREAERSHALRLLYTTEAAQSFTLPILATAGDVREVVQYLKKKPAGVSIVEAMDDVKRRVFEPRKVAAYEFWGIVERHGGDRLHLSRLGWEFARKLAPEAEAYRAVLDNAAPYRAALEWMHEENHDLVTHTQVAAYWQKFYPSGTNGQNQKAVESSVVCFFHLCQAAEIGTMTIGKRGQPARLRVEREELAGFIEGRLPDAAMRKTATGAEETDTPTLSLSPRAPVAPPRAQSARPEHFLILGHGAAPVIDQLEAMLELLDIKTRAVADNDTDALPLAGEMFQAMRQCDAALIVVTPSDCDEDGAGGYTLKQNILIEINSAFVLYDRRIVLLWNCQMPVPASLSSLRHFTLEGDNLTWEAGVRLMQVCKEFQTRARAERRQAC